MHRNWRFFLPGHLWLLPFTIGFAVFCYVVYGARSWGFRNGVVICIAGTKATKDARGVARVRSRIWGNPGAQTIAGVTCFATSEGCAAANLRAHECTHIAITFMFGIAGTFFVPIAFAALDGSTVLGMAIGGPVGFVVHGLAYGAHFLIEWGIRGFGDWRMAYERIFAERIAYARQRRYIDMPPSQQLEVWT